MRTIYKDLSPNDQAMLNNMAEIICKVKEHGFGDYIYDHIDKLDKDDDNRDDLVRFYEGIIAMEYFDSRIFMAP